VVYGVTRIALPSCDWGADVRAGDAARRAAQLGIPVEDRLASVADASAFVAGPENQLVVPALEQLLAGDDLEAAAAIFNPLVLLGSTGTGKSHLARGITRRWRSLLGEAGLAETGVEYLTAIDFARELRASREEGRLAEFRQRLAKLRLLVIEDLQRLPPRAFVQRELRDTLDVLIEAGAVVVVTTQQPPAAMAKLEAGLRDRLSGGLTVRLQPPGVEARLELLQQAAAARGSRLDAPTLEQLAQKVEGTVPQLLRAIAEHELASKESTLKAGVPIDSARPPLKLKQIIAVVARYYSLTQAALCSAARRKSLVQSRGVAIYLARTLTDLSYAQIGQGLGRRDHSTVMHSRRTFEKLLANDAATQQDIEELQRILTAV